MSPEARGAKVMDVVQISVAALNSHRIMMLELPQPQADLDLLGAGKHSFSREMQTQDRVLQLEKCLGSVATSSAKSSHALKGPLGREKPAL